MLRVRRRRSPSTTASPPSSRTARRAAPGSSGSGSRRGSAPVRRRAPAPRFPPSRFEGPGSSTAPRPRSGSSPPDQAAPGPCGVPPRRSSVRGCSGGTFPGLRPTGGDPVSGRFVFRRTTRLFHVRRIELRDETVGLDALIVIDHDLFPVSAGGTRMLPDVDAREVARLARAITWKFAVCGVRYAGAKAGIRFEGGDRDAVLAAYRRALTPFRDVFLTGPDMGTRPSDFVTPDLVEDLPLWAQSHEGLGMDDLATGHGVKSAAEAALAHLGRELEGATVAIEGFGKVGAGTARACARAGARIVAISTVHGLLSDPAGLDVEQLLELRGRVGDRLVENAARGARPREELFELEVDVLVPGARPDSITRKVAERVRCAVVAPGANIPYAPGAIEVLHRRGIIAIPDFISNSGGVHLYESVEQDDEPEVALVKIAELVSGTVAKTLAAADAEGVAPLEAALREVRAYLTAETGAADKVLDGLVAA